MPVFYKFGGAILYCATPPCTTAGQMLPFFFSTVGCAIFYVLPPPTLLLGQMLPVFFIRLAARTPTVLPPHHATDGADAACFPYGRRVGRPFTLCYPPTLGLEV